MPSFRSLLATRFMRPLLALALLCSAALAWAQTPGKTEVLWLGQSAIRITTPGGKVIMLLVMDPGQTVEF